MQKSPPMPDSESRVQTACLMVIAAIAAGATLYWLRPVLMPFVLAIFFVCGVAPLLELIETRLRAPRMLAVAITFLLGVAALALLWILIWISVASLFNNADTYHDRFEQLVNYASRFVGEPAPPPARDTLPTNDDLTTDDLTTDDLTTDDLTSLDQETGDSTKQLGVFARQQFRRGLSQLSTALMEILSSALMVLIFMFFLILGGTTAAVPRAGVWDQIQSKIRNYIVAKTVISLVTGLVFGLVLWLFGIPLALLFGLLAFLLNYIPNIGPIIASLLPLPLILLNGELSVASMIIVILLSGTVQFVSGNIIEPKIMGDSFELHPVVILLTLMFWGMIWGIVGMFLATPITAAMKILFEKFEHTRPIAFLLAGQLDALQNLGEEGE